MKRVLVLIIFLMSFSSLADVPKYQVKEVNYLLQFIKNSPCRLNRNGTEHSGEKALKHIERKYTYFRDDIKSTEDFIKYAATKSTLSKKYYEVACPNEETIKSKDWLLRELKKFRYKKNTLSNRL